MTDVDTQIFAMTRTAKMPPVSLPALFAEAVQAHPDAIALMFQEQQLTYRDLDDRSKSVATAIINELGSRLEDGTTIAFIAPRGPEAVIAMIGILRAGATYLAIDTEQPLERNAFILTDSGAALLIGGASDGEGLAPGLPRLDLSVAMACPVSSPLHMPRPKTAAYMMYTSGSTGEPKGVVVEHRGAANLACAHRDLFDLEVGARSLAFASFTFDASVSEIFATLAGGATLVIADDIERRDPNALADLLIRDAVNVATIPPSLLPHMPNRTFPDLRLIVVAGEPCAENELRRWSAGRQIINAYGPTEASVCATFSIYRPGDAPNRIGGALSGVNLYVLDEAGAPIQPDQVGQVGELFIGGSGVARGYHRKPELTAERFLRDHRFGDDRVFRSGDLVCWAQDGALEFHGRKDDQVKLAGYRVELQEVACALERLACVRQASVVLNERKQMIAYYVPDGADMPARAVEKQLTSWLPAYMLPSDYVTLGAMPLNSSGKIDRAALLACPGSKPAPQIGTMTHAEQVVGQIWCELLDLPSVQPSDNFYALGGDSLRMTQLLMRLNKDFGTALVPRRFRKFEDLAALAAHVERHLTADASK